MTMVRLPMCGFACRQQRLMCFTSDPASQQVSLDTRRLWLAAYAVAYVQILVQILAAQLQTRLPSKHSIQGSCRSPLPIDVC